ncbi:MAG TPA: hypothetical protein VJT14_05975 [Candidatus Dormibacteraeota bacterium]|nr:hypothetical protein [Candidatus Dormibacteraeota bacterium]
MTDPRRVTGVELERALRDLGPRYPYPPTPNLASHVRLRITAQPIARPRRLELWRDPRRLALVAAVLLVLLGAAALANPVTRDAIAHFFHVRGVIVNREASPLPSLSPGTPLDLGRRTTMADAQSRLSFSIAVPPEVGQPEAVYVVSGIPGGEVALAYAPRPGIPLVKQTGLGLLISEFRGDLMPGFITKGVGPGTTVEEVSVHGDPGWWIAGEPHIIYVKVAGTDQMETLRMAANTLIWEHAGVTYRIESGLSKADVLKIAAGLP